MARIVGIRELELQSVLERSEVSGKDVVPLWLAYVLIGTLVFFTVFVLIWDSNLTIGWRIKRSGFDPALYFYTQAQEAMLRTSEPTRISSVIHLFDRAFSYDISYIERAKNESLFSDIHGYHRFIALIEKYKVRKTADE